MSQLFAFLSGPTPVPKQHGVTRVIREKERRSTTKVFNIHIQLPPVRFDIDLAKEYVETPVRTHLARLISFASMDGQSTVEQL